MTPEVGKKITVFDFDDTLIQRRMGMRLMGLVRQKVRPQHLPDLTLAQIAQLDINHGRVDDTSVGFWEKIALLAHAGRPVFDGVEVELARMYGDGITIYGNTGRSNKDPWVRMTVQVLKDFDIANYFADILYTPSGVKTAVSKAHGFLTIVSDLKEIYGYREGDIQIEFWEDDPRTVMFIAKRFPNMTINWVWHGISGLLVSRRELEQMPNVRRVAVFSKK